MASRVEKNDTVACSIKPPWWGLGKTVDHIMTVPEAFELALAFRVNKENLYRQFSGELPASAKTLYAKLSAALPEGLAAIIGRPTKAGMLTVRPDIDFGDSAGDLGIVGSDYSVIQHDAICKAAQSIVGSINAQVETAGTLMNNKLGFLVARFPTDVDIVGDAVRPFILLNWSHDGSTALQIQFTTIRVVCWNTLSMALAQGRGSIKIRHNKNAIDDAGNIRSSVIDNARTELFAGGVDSPVAEIAKAAGEYVNAQTEWLTRLASTPVTESLVRDYFRVIKPVNLQSVNQTWADNRRSEFHSVWNGKMHGDDSLAMHLDDGSPTAYRLLQAVTFVADHLDEGKSSEGKSAAELRFNRITVGVGRKLRDDATVLLDEALATGGKSLTENIEKQHYEYDQLVQRTTARMAVAN